MTVSPTQFETPLDLYRALLSVWAGDTAAPTGAWSADRPAKNHCSVTSLVVQDIFGGDLLTTRTSGGTHFYNRIDGARWDLTVGQFEEPIPYQDTPATREAAFTDTTEAKYRLVLERLDETARA